MYGGLNRYCCCKYMSYHWSRHIFDHTFPCRPKDAQGVVVRRRGERTEKMFTKLAGADGEIDSEELQDMLTAYFSKGIHIRLLPEHVSEKKYIIGSPL